MDQIATKISSGITAREKKLMFRLNQQSFNEQRVQGFQERGEVLTVLVAPVVCPMGVLMQLLMQ